MKAQPKPKPRGGGGIRHREVPPPWTRRNRNDGVIDIPGPVIDVPGDPTMALIPYREMPRPPRPLEPSRSRVASAARKVVPTPVAQPFTKERVGRAAAYTGGLVGATLAAGELGVSESKPVAVGTTALGALGMLFLDAHWQQLSQGVLGAGVAQLTTALHSDRLRAKVDKETKRKHELEQAIVAMAVQQAHAVATHAVANAPAAPATAPATGAPPRNAVAPFDLSPAYAAVEQAHAEVGDPGDPRNAWGWPPEEDYAAAA